MNKAGLRQEGILRAAGKNNLGICDEVWHAIIREDRFVNFELQDMEWLFETKDHE